MDRRRVANILMGLGVLLELWGTAAFVWTPLIPPPCAPPANGTPPGGCSRPFTVTLESVLSWGIGTGLILAGVALRIWDRRHPAVR